MMERHVPVVDGCVVAAERYFEVVVLLETDNAPLHLYIEARGRRRSRSGVRTGGETQLSEEAHLGGQRGVEVQNKLPLAEAAVCAVLIGCAKIEIAEARDVG